MCEGVSVSAASVRVREIRQDREANWDIRGCP